MNKNVERRAELLGLKPGSDSFGGITRYEGLTVENLRKLVDEGFAELDERQNDAPSIAEFLEFAEGTDLQVTFHGYAVSLERDDYRVSVEGFNAHARNMEEMAMYARVGGAADEFDADANGNVYAWWD